MLNVKCLKNGEKILSNVNVVVCGQVNNENCSLPVAVRVSKLRVLKLPTETAGFTWNTKNEDGEKCSQPCDNVEHSQHYKSRGSGTKHEREEIHERNNGPAVKHQQQKQIT